MWFSFWRSRDRFSLDELRYLTDQLQKVHIINEVNKDFVIEVLRSIAEIVTYGDQHDPSFFEFFMEKQVMGELVRILKISRTVTVSLQLLQSISIMIQNLKNDHAIYYIFSNEHINFLITYPFDFRNEELLSYYISFLRAISGKLNKNTISMLVTTKNDDVVSFPLYNEAIRFAFHEEKMIRIAIRALTLNVYHVGDHAVNKYIASAPHADYFVNLVSFFSKQCIRFNNLVSAILTNSSAESTSIIHAGVDEIEDYLYYFSDVISAGIPDVGRLITDNILQLLIFPLLLPSLRGKNVNDLQIGDVASLYLLCCIIRIVKIKDLANTVAAAIFYPPEVFIQLSEVKLNGHLHGQSSPQESESCNETRTEVETCSDSVSIPSSPRSSKFDGDVQHHDISSDSTTTLREILLSYVIGGEDAQVLGSLCFLATLLQTKELDETMLDALGILPQRKQHRNFLLQALVGEASGEEQLFSSESNSLRDDVSSELDIYMQNLKKNYGFSCSQIHVEASPRVHRYQVLDALVNLLCRSNISAETLWDGGWLLRQLLPHSEAEFNTRHLHLLNDSYKKCTSGIFHEIRGIWLDLLVAVLCDEWIKCKKAIEASSPRKEPKCILFTSRKFGTEVTTPVDPSSFTAGEKMLELVKVFVLLHQIQYFTLGRALPEQPPVHPPMDIPSNSRARTSGMDVLGPKPGTELRIVDAVPCRIAFERGKERHFCFLAISVGTSGWVVLAEELPLKQEFGVVRVAAPLAGSNVLGILFFDGLCPLWLWNFVFTTEQRTRPRIDDKHPRWLHLRIRPSTLPFVDTIKSGGFGKMKAKALVDGRWTLAFWDEESCRSALSMILEEIELQCNEVERRIKPLLEIKTHVDFPNLSPHPSEPSSSSEAFPNSM